MGAIRVYCKKNFRKKANQVEPLPYTRINDETRQKIDHILRNGRAYAPLLDKICSPKCIELAPHCVNSTKLTMIHKIFRLNSESVVDQNVNFIFQLEP